MKPAAPVRTSSRMAFNLGALFSRVAARLPRVATLAGAVVLVAGSVTSLAANAADEAPDLDELRARVAETLPGIAVTSVAETPVDGLYELVVDGTIYYVDASGKFLLEGSMIELESRSNLTEARLGKLHMGLLDAMGDENMLIYQPDEPTGRSITVFTDISCGFCRRLHGEIDTLLDAGIAVKYLLFPRAGLGSSGEQALEDVWCNENPQEAMTTAKSGGVVPSASCPNPIASHVALAEQVGLRGTPLIYTDAGDRIPGYREAAALVEMVESSEPYTGE